MNAFGRSVRRGLLLLLKSSLSCVSTSLRFQSHTGRSISLPDPPTNCCMSGCANCVWLEYAQDLEKLYRDEGEVTKQVLEAIEDPSLKIFLSIELRNKLKSSESEE